MLLLAFGVLGCGGMREGADPRRLQPESTALTREQPVVADATIQNGAYARENDGRSSFLYVNTTSYGTTDNDYRSLLRFSLAGLTQVTSAKLRLTGRLQSDVVDSVEVFAFSIGGAWSEEEVTWSTRPWRDGPVARQTVRRGPESRHEWDLTAHVQSLLRAGRSSLELALVGAVNTDGRVRFVSRENSAGPGPDLVIDDGVPAPAPDPVASTPAPEPTAPPPVPEPAPAPLPSSGSPTVAGCPVFPADNEWNRRIVDDAIDPSSANYIAAMNGGSRFLHPDFGGGGAYGIPWVSVPGDQPRVTMHFDWDDESDPGPYPFPMDAPIEGGPASDGDRHVLVVDRDNCKLFETFYSWPAPSSWSASSGAIFDLRSNALRPLGWTSADAAGLPVLPGLIRREEVLSGRINHALRFTVARTQRAYVYPATHFASSLTDPNLPPLGIRVRLKAGYDISRFSPGNQVILTAMKEYGMFLADNGSDWFVSGEANLGWNDDELRQLKSVPASAFEVVRTPAIQR